MQTPGSDTQTWSIRYRHIDETYILRFCFFGCVHASLSEALSVRLQSWFFSSWLWLEMCQNNQKINAIAWKFIFSIISKSSLQSSSWCLDASVSTYRPFFLLFLRVISEDILSKGYKSPFLWIFDISLSGVPNKRYIVLLNRSTLPKKKLIFDHSTTRQTTFEDFFMGRFWDTQCSLFYLMRLAFSSSSSLSAYHQLSSLLFYPFVS